MNKNETSRPSLSIFIALFLTVFFVIFTFALTNIASIYIIGDLGGSKDIATYTITFFCIGNALSIPLGSPLSRRIGTVKLLTICLLLFAGSSWLCAIAPNYPLFLSLRLLQGIVSGPLFFLVFSLIGTLAPKEWQTIFLSVLVTIFTIGPVIGASWGGWIAYDYNWRYLFYFNIPCLLFLAIFLKNKLASYEQSHQEEMSHEDGRGFFLSFNWIGYVFYAVGICCLSLVITLGQELDWFRSPLICGMFIGGLSSMLFYILLDLYHPFPVMELRFFKNLAFTFGILNLIVLFSAYFGMIILLSFWLHLYVNYTFLWIGILIGSMAFGGFFPVFLIMEGFKRLDFRVPLAIGIALIAFSCFYTAIFNEEINFARIALSRIIAGFGLALFVPPIFQICFHSFSKECAPSIVVLFQVCRSLASGLGAAIYTTIWLRRHVFYHDRLGSKITSASLETQKYFLRAKQFDVEGEAANVKLESLLNRQSTSLALDDTFYLMAWLITGLLFVLALSLFLKKTPFSIEKTSA